MDFSQTVDQMFSFIQNCPMLYYLFIGGVTLFVILAVVEKYIYRKLSNANLRNKHIVITGGSSGIGKFLAIEAAVRGANISIVARDKEKLHLAKQEIVRHCIHPTQIVSSVSLDVCNDYDEIEKAIGLMEQECGPIYILANCAGSAICGKLEDLSPIDIRKQLELNCLGSIYVTKAVVEGMKVRGEGHILLTSSQAGLLGIYGFSPYSASKFALRGFAEALHMEVQCYGIKVTLAFPPDTDTPGYALEEVGKPKETKLICQTSGLYQPSQVAKQMLQDTLGCKFFSYVGLDGFMLSTLCGGMSPCSSIQQLIHEISLMGPFRVLAVIYLLSFKRIIEKCMAAKNQSKKAE